MEVNVGTDENATVAALRQRFAGDQIINVLSVGDEVTVVVTREGLPAICQFLRDEPSLAYNFLVDVTAVDYLNIGRVPRFDTVYHLLAIPSGRRLRLRVPVDEDEPVVPSVFPIWPAANFFEREVFDLFGIEFDGHPDLRRIMLPDNWDGHPLRKDYPLGYEEVQFTFNFDEVARRKPFATQ